MLNRKALEQRLRECPPNPKLVALLGKDYWGAAEYHFDGHGNVKIRLVPKLGAEIDTAA
jgi:hypothetical protein